MTTKWKWITFVTAGLSIMGAFSFGLNHRNYRQKPLGWKLAKSFADVVLVVLAGVNLPALLVGWIVYWVTSPIKNGAVRVTISVLSGLVLGIFGELYLELLLLGGLMAIDKVTGKDGFLGLVQKYDREERQAAAA